MRIMLGREISGVGREQQHDFVGPQQHSFIGRRLADLPPATGRPLYNFDKQAMQLRKIVQIDSVKCLNTFDLNLFSTSDLMYICADLRN